MNQDRTIWLVRHGNRRDFAEPEWMLTAPRPHDAELSKDGVEQARDVGRRLAGEVIAHIFCSPFLRAVETACQIASSLGLKVKVEHGLAEMMLHQWFPDTHDFLPLEELAARYPAVDSTYGSALEPVFPETPEEAIERAAQTAVNLLTRFEGNLLMVGHGGSIYGLCQGILGFRPAIHTYLCCLIKISGQPGKWRLQADGSDTSHLTRFIDDIRLA